MNTQPNCVNEVTVHKQGPYMCPHLHWRVWVVQVLLGTEITGLVPVDGPILLNVQLSPVLEGSRSCRASGKAQRHVSKRNLKAHVRRWPASLGMFEAWHAGVAATAEL